jgi:hypothetical protein
VGVQVGTCVGLPRAEGFDTQRNVYVLSTQFGALVYVPRRHQVATSNTAESNGGSAAVYQHQPAHRADNHAQGQSVDLLTSLIHRSRSLLSLPSALSLGKAKEETSKAAGARAAGAAAGDNTATTPDATSGVAGGGGVVKGDESIGDHQQTKTIPPGHTAFSWTDKRSEDLPQHAGLPGV